MWIAGGLCSDLWFNGQISRWWLSLSSLLDWFLGWFNGLCSFWGGYWWFLLIWGGWWWVAFLRVLSFQTLENIFHVKYNILFYI